VANLGSGGRSFDIPAHMHIHVDLVKRRLLGHSGIVADVEYLPLRNASVDLALCVGSVINHGNAKAMIGEIARIAKPGARAILEFDSADGLHQLARPTRNGVVRTTTFFNNHMLTLFEYSPAYVEGLFKAQGMSIEDRYSFHIISSLMLGIGLPHAIAARFILLDPVARLFSSMRYRGSNVLLVVRKP
jgi:SAM-dependent methyltransferase